MRIGIVGEQSHVADALCRTVSLHASHEVIWIADIVAAPQLSVTNTPDLILMALPLGGCDSVDVTRRIMSGSPCPILVVTESGRTNARFVFDAMAQGAFGAVDMPPYDAENPLQSGAALFAKIDTIARAVGHKALSPAPEWPHTRQRKENHDVLVAIGASAGGPAAVAAILQALPKDLQAAIVLVQHVDEGFVSGMTTWLTDHTGHTVTVAMEGERPTPGRILVASAVEHLVLRAPGRLGYTAEPKHYAYRPSVDVFFESVSRAWRGDAIGVLLTGMGKDGALGLKALRDKGHVTIAQNEATSAVYGMPKAAAAIDAASDILPLDRIAPRIVELVTSDWRLRVAD